MNKKSAFTLAEVIITLTIVGVVAAMTIPDMVQNIQDQQFRTAWKKTYADISQSVKLLALDYNNNLTGIFTGRDSARDKILKNMSVIQKCDADSDVGPTGCWHDSTHFYKLSGAAYASDWSAKSRAILNNGALFALELNSSACTNTSVPNDDGCLNVSFDVNGFKGPNMVGKDIYRATLIKDGTILPWGTQGDDYYGSSTNGCDLKASANAIGWTCSAIYLYQ